MKSGSDTTALEVSARAAALVYQDALAPGATWYRSQVHRAVLAVSDDCLGADITVPTTDQVPAAPQNAIRTPTGSMKLTLVEV